MEVNPVIFEAAAACRRSLLKCQRVERLMKDEWAENRLADFNLWDSGIGASARNRASLDARLMMRKDAQKIVGNLVQVLTAVVEECIARALEVQSNGLEEVLEPDGRGDTLFLPGDLPPRSLSPWSDDSSSDSPSENEAIGHVDTDSSLDAAKKNVDSVLDQLARIALLIRRAGKRSRLEKADRLLKLDDHLDLEAHLTTMMLLQGLHRSASYTFSAAQLDRSKLSKVQLRLISANKRRRNRFLYAQTHAEGLETMATAKWQRMDLGETTEVGQDDHSPTPEPVIQKDRDEANEPVTAKIRSKGIESVTTGTTASGVTNLILPASSAVPSQAATTQLSKTVAKQEYPYPPRIKTGALVFRCPCCCQVLPEMLRDRDRWRKHLAEDLSPYTCVLLNCPTPHVLYATKESWVHHILEDHRSVEYWVCFACPSTPRFDMEVDFVTHTSQEHYDTIPKDQINSLKLVSRRSVPSELESCPLCNWPESEGVRVDANNIMDHVADHVHAFSLLALPWRPDDADEFDHARNKYSVTKVQSWLSQDGPESAEVEDNQGDKIMTPPPRRTTQNHYFHSHEYFEESLGNSNSSSQAKSESSAARELEQMRQDASLEFDDDTEYPSEPQPPVTGGTHEHKLLSFYRVRDTVILTHHGQEQPLELSAQLSGMFFVPEMPTSSDGGANMQPEVIICYRRNLFQITGSLTIPRGQLSVWLADTEEQGPMSGNKIIEVPVTSTEVTVSAIESINGHPVRLIAIPWEISPENVSEMPQGPDQEPPSMPLIPLQDDGTELEKAYATYPIKWRRLQFRLSTANNASQQELQQYFLISVKVVGRLTNKTKITLAEARTAPIVVRGRFPENLQARKEVPLLSSRDGSQGKALVEAGLGVATGPLKMKHQESKLRGPALHLKSQDDTTLAKLESPVPQIPSKNRADEDKAFSPKHDFAKFKFNERLDAISNNITSYRIVIMGSGGVGKTALATQFCLHQFVETYDPTMEDLYRKQVVVDGLACMIEVMDTAGQEEYKNLRDQWIRDGEGFLLVYSISSRSSYYRVKRFYEQIQLVKESTSPPFGVPIILVGAKRDRVTEREVSTQEARVLASELNCEFFEISSKNGTDVENIFYDVVRMLRHQREEAARPLQNESTRRQRGAAVRPIQEADIPQPSGVRVKKEGDRNCVVS